MLHLIQSVNGLYSVIVSASCTFSFLSTFHHLYLDTNHPNLMQVPGRPLAGSKPTLMLTLAGDFYSNIESIRRISFIDVSGNYLENHDFVGVFQDEENLIIQTVYEENNGLTKTPFFVRLEGTDKFGTEFWRSVPTLISPSSTEVSVTASSSMIKCNPGNTTSADFLISVVSDLGESQTITIA